MIIDVIQETKNLNINNTLLLAFIKGLKYDENEHKYTFKKKKYKLRDVKIQSKRSQFYFFVNLNDPTDVKIVKYSGGVPLQDGFNNVELDEAQRKRTWKKIYYEKTIREKRRQESKIKKQAKAKAKLEAIEQAKAEREAKLKPIKCKFCGKEFKPTQTPQKFCCASCRIKYFGKKQGEYEKEKRKVEKTCPICNKKFIGTSRDNYCSKECYNEAQKILKKIRYNKNKNKKTK